MTRHLAALASLLTATAILLAGHGLQLTLLPLRADALGWNATEIGFSGSAYFAGFVVGCLRVPALVAGVGHVRVFMVLTALATSALLGIAIFDGLVAWSLLRFVTGCAIAGLYLVIESWINEQTPNDRRGGMLSTYTVVVLGAMVVGQWLLNLAAPASDDVIILGTILLCLAAVPVGVSRAPAPARVTRARFSLMQVLEASPAAVVGSLVSGLVNGAFFTLAPVVGRYSGLETSGIAGMMSAGILGGALFQFPLGRFSDRVDRRWVMLFAMGVGAGISLLGMLLGDQGFEVTIGIMFLFGGTLMPLYSLCLAHANDNAEGNFLEIGTGILIVNAGGSIIGPIAAALAMDAAGAAGFYAFAAACLGVGAGWTLVSLRRRPRRGEYFEPYAATAETTQGAVGMDPRSPDGAGLAHEAQA